MASGQRVSAVEEERTRSGEVPRFGGGLHDLQNGVYAWLVPNGSWGESNAGLIVGEGESLLVDTLWDLEYTRTMLAAMEPLLEGAPLRYVANTHADGDHWWGNRLVAEAEIITTQAARDEMLRLQPGSMILLGRVGGLLSALPLFGADKIGHWLQNMVAPYDFREVRPRLPSRTFEGELVLEVGGREVQLLQVGPAHTEGDLLVYVPDARTLFAGDIVFLGSTPVIWTGPMGNWLAALERILKLDVDTIVPGHGPLTGKDGVRQVLAYWRYVEDQVTERHQAGVPAREAAFDIALSDDFAGQPFAGWDAPERIMTNVHTIYRHLEGRPGHPRPLELANLLRKQALLAAELRD